MAVMYALKRGIEAVFQLENSELAAEPLPDRTGDNAWAVLLLFEAAERWRRGPAAPRVRARRHPGRRARSSEDPALRPDDRSRPGAARARPPPDAEKCAQACYDCLLSYGNQWEHRALDRHKAKDALLALAAGTLEIGGIGGEDRATQHARLAKRKQHLRDRVAQGVRGGGYRLPDLAQALLDDVPSVRPDFSYRRADGDCAIFIDGPVHEHAHIAQKDKKAQQRLENEGWLVLRFTTDRSAWPAIFSANSKTFGAGK
jgi:hypothetical protein